MKYEQI